MHNVNALTLFFRYRITGNGFWAIYLLGNVVTAKVTARATATRPTVVYNIVSIRTLTTTEISITFFTKKMPQKRPSRLLILFYFCYSTVRLNNYK